MFIFEIHIYPIIGHMKHEYTSGTAFPAIFKFISHMFSIPVPIRLSKSGRNPIIGSTTVGHSPRLSDDIAHTARRIEIIEIEDSDGERQNDLFIARQMRKVHIETRSTSAVMESIDIDSPEDRTINTIMESIDLDPPEANEALSAIFGPPEANGVFSTLFDPPEADEFSSIIFDPPGANEASSIILDPPGTNEISSITFNDIIESDVEYATEVAHTTQSVPSTSLNEPVQSTSPIAPVPSTSLNASVQSTSLNAPIQSTSLNAITEDEVNARSLYISHCRIYLTVSVTIISLSTSFHSFAFLFNSKPQVQSQGFFRTLLNTISSVKSVFSLGWFDRTETRNEPSLNEAPQMTERERAKATAQMAPLQPKRLNTEKRAARRIR